MVSIRFLDQFKLYEDQSGMMSYAERAIRKAVNILERSYCNHLNPSIFEGGKKRRDDSIIVSMTTFPARIGYVHLAIKSLLNQTVSPRKIILWLAKDQQCNAGIHGEYGILPILRSTNKARQDRCGQKAHQHIDYCACTNGYKMLKDGWLIHIFLHLPIMCAEPADNVSADFSSLDHSNFDPHFDEPAYCPASPC